MILLHVTKSLLIRPEEESASRLTAGDVTGVIGFQMPGHMFTCGTETGEQAAANGALEHVFKVHEHVVPQLAHLFRLPGAQWASVPVHDRIVRPVAVCVPVTGFMDSVFRGIHESCPAGVTLPLGTDEHVVLVQLLVRDLGESVGRYVGPDDG